MTRKVNTKKQLTQKAVRKLCTKTYLKANNTLNIQQRVDKFNKEKDESEPMLTKYALYKAYKDRKIKYKAVKKNDVRKFEIEHHTYKWWIGEIQREL